MKQILMLSVVWLMTACCCKHQPQPSEPTATAVEYGAEIVLPAPDLSRGMTVGEALANRRSWREYGAEKLSLEELSGVLYAAAGINRPEEKRLTAPSALALYPIRVYAFFAEGIYRYEAKTHKLVRIKEGNFMAVTGAQPFVAQAAMNLVYVADTEVYQGRPIAADHVRYLCGQDAAGFAENVNIYAAGTGLRSITRGSASPDLLATLGLESPRYLFALAQSVGK